VEETISITGNLSDTRALLPAADLLRTKR